LLVEGLEGNFERENGDRIHAGAWPLVSVVFDRQVADWSARYHTLAGTGLASDQIEAIEEAVPAGRVRCVLAAADPDGGETVDDLCEEALKRSAEVYVIPREAMPTPSPIA